ncbi:MAG: Wzz/FepE/Etk N-terminal domain-containing protein [Lacipirellulaceae bacterium]
MAQSFTKGGLRQIVETLFRHKKKACTLALVALAVGTLAVFFYPRKYRSEAKVFLQVGRETVGIDPTATTGQTMSLMQNGRDEEIQSAKDVISSRGLIEKVVDRVSPDLVLGKLAVGDAKPNPITEWMKGLLGSALETAQSIDPVSTRERAVIKVEKNLEVDAERSSTVLVMTYDAKTPELAQTILDEVVEVYKEEHLRIHRNQKSSQFFDEQNEILRERLVKAEQRLRDAKSELGLASVESRATTLEGQIRNIDQDRYATEQELATSRARMADLTNQLEETPERLVSSKTSKPNEGADLLRDQLYQLQVKKIDLEARYSEEHPLVKAINDQVKQAEAIVNKQEASREETIDDVNPIHRQLLLDYKQQQAAVAGFESRLEKLSNQREQLRKQLVKLNADEIRLAELSREVQIANSKVFQYEDKFEQARFDKELESEKVSNVSIVQDATLAEKPISPSKVLIGLATILFSTAAPLALALGLERSDDRLRQESDIEELLDLPVLASVPESSLHSRLLPTTGVVSGTDY